MGRRASRQSVVYLMDIVFVVLFRSRNGGSFSKESSLRIDWRDRRLFGLGSDARLLGVSSQLSLDLFSMDEKRRFQFNLRDLLLAVTLIAVGLPGASSPWQPRALWS